jgi:thiol:disulfide interchange protein DsbD
MKLLAALRLIVAIVLLSFSFQCFAQQDSSVHFSFRKQRLNEQEVLLTIKAEPLKGGLLYALQKSDSDAVYSSISFDSSALNLLKGSIAEKGKTEREKDETLGATTIYFRDSVIWTQKVNVSDSTVVKGVVSYIVKKDDQYLPGEQSFKFYIEKPPLMVAGIGNGIVNASLIWIFITAFGGGLLALLTPCVYSMVPVTVSFFTKRSRSRQEGIRNALYYSSSIVIIFTLLGFLISILFGPAALNNLATNWIANLVFFLLFLLFGISFLGAFEITLPASWSNNADSKAGMGSFAGIFFMALTLVVVSFSCTGPIIGNLLVLAAKGSYWGPLTGMFGFSFALALPFALFALFPSLLNKMGKAGGWLNSVKVTLGFIELALALKFLSNADLVKGWRILDREVFLSLWIVIFLLLGIYLLGKIRFHHDDALPKNDFGLPYLTVTRLFFAIAAFCFAVYMMPGLWGAPLKGISAFVPPMGTQDFNASGGSAAVHGIETGKEQQNIRYKEQMKAYEPEVVTKYGMVTYFDYDEALAVAKRENKPLMLDFTGVNCVNCRKMEGQVWSDPAVMKKLKEDFILVSLYVDVHNIDLPEPEHYYSEALSQQVETLGDKNADLQVKRFGANTQPYYFFVDGRGNQLVDEGYGYDPDVRKFLGLLERAEKEFVRRNNPA